MSTKKLCSLLYFSLSETTWWWHQMSKSAFCDCDRSCDNKNAPNQRQKRSILNRSTKRANSLRSEMLAPFPRRELYFHRWRVYTWAIISSRRNLGTIIFHWYWWQFQLRGLSHTNLGYNKIHRSRLDLRCFEVDSPQLDIHLPRRMLRQIQKQHNLTLLSIFLCTVPLFCP